MEQRASDGRALVLVQFDYTLHLGDEAQAVGGEMIYHFLLAKRCLGWERFLAIAFPPFSVVAAVFLLGDTDNDMDKHQGLLLPRS